MIRCQMPCHHDGFQGVKIHWQSRRRHMPTSRRRLRFDINHNHPSSASVKKKQTPKTAKALKAQVGHDHLLLKLYFSINKR